jgi:hypothetical protein
LSSSPLQQAVNGGVCVTSTSVSLQMYYVVKVEILQVSGNILWSDSHANQLLSSGARSVAKELRKRVEDQEKSSGKTN